jgi:hypothetical protein
LQEARDVEKQARTLKRQKGKVPEAEFQKAAALLKDGPENLRLVDAGGGHNKKYSSLLIDAAISNFENAIAELKTNQKPTKK